MDEEVGAASVWEISYLKKDEDLPIWKKWAYVTGLYHLDVNPRDINFVPSAAAMTTTTLLAASTTASGMMMPVTTEQELTWALNHSLIKSTVLVTIVWSRNEIWVTDEQVKLWGYYLRKCPQCLRFFKLPKHWSDKHCSHGNARQMYHCTTSIVTKAKQKAVPGQHRDQNLGVGAFVGGLWVFNLAKQRQWCEGFIINLEIAGQHDKIDSSIRTTYLRVSHGDYSFCSLCNITCYATYFKLQIPTDDN